MTFSFWCGEGVSSQIWHIFLYHSLPVRLFKSKSFPACVWPRNIGIFSHPDAGRSLGIDLRASREQTLWFRCSFVPECGVLFSVYYSAVALPRAICSAQTSMNSFRQGHCCVCLWRDLKVRENSSVAAAERPRGGVFVYCALCEYTNLVIPKGKNISEAYKVIQTKHVE